MYGKLSQKDPNINKQGVGLGLYISNVIAKLLNPNVNLNGLNV
jgi:K+-sensing histidine kinase KdpD